MTPEQKVPRYQSHAYAMPEEGAIVYAFHPKTTMNVVMLSVCWVGPDVFGTLDIYGRAAAVYRHHGGQWLTADESTTDYSSAHPSVEDIQVNGGTHYKADIIRACLLQATPTLSGHAWALPARLQQMNGPLTPDVVDKLYAVLVDAGVLTPTPFKPHTPGDSDVKP